ncbi:MAG TPA: biopolymer transporter ExbD [Pirellulaceae bacterium]|nr:biopolymer transporter ExbD [Pirellulaceae bacterium]
MKIARKTYKVEIPTMAMGDIAFNLLIFFVILARSQDESHIQWRPAQAPDLKSISSAKASLAIDRHGKIFLNGQETGTVGLADKLETLLGNAAAGKRLVLLKADRDTQALLFEPVIEAISAAGGDLVHVLDKQQTK